MASGDMGIKAKNAKQDESINSNVLTKQNLQELYDSSTEGMRNTFIERFEEMKNILSQVVKSQSNMNVISPEYLEKILVFMKLTPN